VATTRARLTEDEQRSWNQFVGEGIAHSIEGLSEMVGREVSLKSHVEPKWIEVKDAPSLLGGAETLTVAVYLRVEGAASGHMVLVYSPDTAFELVDMLLELAPGTTQSLDPMERSALGEMDNIMGSFFLNAVADATNLELMPSPPAVMMGMAGSVLDSVLAEIMMEADEVLVADTVFGTSDRQINGTFLVIPSGDLVRVLLQRRPAA
jgi:chemotaxis protein CheC